ncbi:hypothetical protein DL1_12300 [Thioclava dalianensis]|uniref:Uncharacterized protein n=1 Tax=Thioclava dalianensis TaxID=1185766 RepID=A0A074TDV8_9RHOB|nr:hypothetical protein DL1_12300 [Thioclava dalianensis]
MTHLVRAVPGRSLVYDGPCLCALCKERTGGDWVERAITPAPQEEGIQAARLCQGAALFERKDRLGEALRRIGVFERNGPTSPPSCPVF